MVAVAVTGAALAWIRPDPLPPVDLVENIVPKAFELHSLIGVLSIGALAMLPAAALWHIRGGSDREGRHAAPGAAMAAYLSANIVAVVFGEFPTPVLGFGASPVLGAVLGLSLLPGVSLQLTECKPDFAPPR